MPVRSGSLESLRELNRLRVVDALRRHKTLSRADIARVTGLSRSTISALVADLHSRGFVTERAERDDERPRPAALGRPPVMLRLHPSAGIAVGVDFDHLHVRVAVADLSGCLLAERAVDFDVDEDARSALDLAGDLVRRALADAAVEHDHVLGVGVALAGPVDQADGRLHDSTILAGWIGVDAGAELRGRLGVPVHLDNDANLGALAEVTLGAGRCARTAVYLQLSSGVGAGLIVDGRPFRGSAGVAGEIGHVVVDADGDWCRCGRYGCLETVASSKAVVDRVSWERQEALGLERLLELAEAGDAACRTALAQAGAAAGEVLGEVCNLLNPEKVVVGGDLSAAGETLLAPLRDALMRAALPAVTRNLEVVAGELGDRANLLGAIALAIAQSEPAIANRIAPLPSG